MMHKSLFLKPKFKISNATSTSLLHTESPYPSNEFGLCPVHYAHAW
ncbi:MAG: hypothetical protein ACI81W_003611, partial [Saprospiraceae bacterium]